MVRHIPPCSNDTLYLIYIDRSAVGVVFFGIALEGYFARLEKLKKKKIVSQEAKKVK